MLTGSGAMPMNSKLFLHICAGLLFATVSAADVLLDTDSAWNGGALAYPLGQPKITSLRLKLNQGDSTPIHCHPVPTLGYLVAGSLKVETASGQSTILHAGEAIVESMRSPHRGIVVQGPVEIIVFHAGSADVPSTVLQGAADYEQYCAR